MRPPKSTVCQPHSPAAATSSSANPPSGPTAKAIFDSVPTARLLRRLRPRRKAAGMRQPARTSLPPAEVLEKIGRRLAWHDFHQLVPPTTASKLPQRPDASDSSDLGGWLGDASPGHQRDQSGHPQFDGFLDKPALPVLLGQRHDAQRHSHFPATRDSGSRRRVDRLVRPPTGRCLRHGPQTRRLLRRTALRPVPASLAEREADGGPRRQQA